ncbi:kinase-like protein [Delitschia confertaspora ATCC 74209]|uniref:Kinase-like protein n=1 Tax=Delitschia confertaspora ATCC 74209 TaxID=1513339 RepID=A0A9P4MT01_9PLEO|nr:kinase-like protein [Delitschia confertaspora ATCC 74209]
MASLDGISFDVTTQHVSRTILSSVGGFSQPARRNIRTLQDLLSTIRRFNLDVFESSGLRYDGFIGEGVSYKVSKCIHKQSRKLYAVKQVKLPSAMADFGAFERQVACVLRDVEVMSCLARHKNILKIFGYGWNIERGGVIPFLVTEFAAEGTLRAFLKNNSVSVHEKLLFCRDVAQGLHFLHVAGIAHGDLKLDNVLVTPFWKLVSQISVTLFIFTMMRARRMSNSVMEARWPIMRPRS